VEAGQNSDAIGKHDVEQSVGKAGDERAPCLAVGNGARERMFGDEMHDEVE
jgi:hypothetical protein